MFTEFVQKYRQELNHIATAVRSLSMDAILQAKSGHLGLALGGAEMGTLLYFMLMQHHPQNSKWLNRDRFVLSAGHGCMLQYALLHLSGYDISIDDLRKFRQLHSKTPGHPEYRHTDGIECTTGPLGQGIANAVGMAIAERMLAARFNIDANPLIDHRTYVIAGDGCMMEGVSAEACSLAGHLKLNRLIILYDANNITIDGTIDITFSEDVAQRFSAYGFNIFFADAHSFDSLASALSQAYTQSSLPNGQTGPSLIICRSIAGKGSTKWEANPKIHGNPMSATDVLEAKAHLQVEDLTPFFVSEQAYLAAQKLLALSADKYEKWQEKITYQKQYWLESCPEKLALWKEFFEDTELRSFSVEDLKNASANCATRVSSGKALALLANYNKNLVGGSADLAGSNASTIANSSFINAQDFSGRNIHFGVREHGMAAICNGIGLHGGLRAYCATFLVFSDYMRPAIRLAALMQIPTIFIFTHDSYGVGEDGPTHQPVEHADSLRLIPKLNVFRPADSLETYYAWEQTLCDYHNPSALLLTRQDVPSILNYTPELGQQLAYGAVIVKDFFTPDNLKLKKIILIASGSEVKIALQTAQKLEAESLLSIRVISCFAPTIFMQHSNYLTQLIPADILVIAVEASTAQSFTKIVGSNGHIYNMQGFGISAPIAHLADYFGFTVEKFSDFVIKKLG